MTYLLNKTFPVSLLWLLNKISEAEDAFFTGLAPIWNIFTISNEKKTSLLLFPLCIFKFQTLLLPEFVIILLYVEANPVWTCR